MSFAIVAIAGMHALPPIIGAIITKKSWGLFRCCHWCSNCRCDWKSSFCRL